MNPWRDLGKLPRPIWVLFGSTLVNRVGTMAVPFLVLYLTTARGFTPAAAGGVLALYGAAALVAGPLSGRIVDRVGPLRVMQGSLVAAGTLQVLFPLASHPAAIVGMAMALGFVAEAYRPASMSSVADLAPPDQLRPAYALIRLAINLGMSIGPALGGFLAMVSFPAIFVTDGLTTLAAATVLLAAGIAPGTGRGVAPGAPDPVPTADASSPWSALRDGRLRGFLLGVFFLNVACFQGESTMPLYLVRDLGLAPSTYGLLFTVNTVLIVLLELPLTHAIGAWDLRRTLALGALLYATGFGALGLVSGVGGVFATVIVWTFGEMVFSPTASAYVAGIAPDGRRGAYMGVFTATFSLSFIVAPSLGMASLEHFGGRLHWAAVFAVGALATALLLGGAYASAPRQAEAA
jgi:MFS family permease